MSKTVFIGSVISSKVALETLIESGIKVDLVCSLDEELSNNVSDYYPIHEIARDMQIPYIKFKKINDEEVLDRIRSIEPDFIFVIGLSQLISQHILDTAQKYVVGFHPTPLPKHRGRAAIPWQIILGIRESKVSLFKLDQGMDSGDIICQYPYKIEKSDYAIDVYNKVCNAMRYALKECIPHIYNNSVRFAQQNEGEATYLLARRPEDGQIDWSSSAEEIETLVRATSKPYPGAFAYYKNSKVIFWKCHIERNDKYIGIPGQIAWIRNNEGIGIVVKDALIVVTDYEAVDKIPPFIIGHKFS